VTGIVAVMSAKYEVDQDEAGRWLVVDVEHKPHRYPMPGKRYDTREEAEARAARYNLILAE
jgi:hypothetical protein